MTSDKLTLRADRVVQLMRSTSGSGSILLYSTKDGDESQMNVNSDGSPRAYHLLDPQGKKYALNDMYSGGVRVFENDVEIRVTKDMSKEQRKATRAQYYDVFSRFVSENGNFGVAESTYDARNDPGYKLGDDFGADLDPPAPSVVVSLRDTAWSFLTNIFFATAPEPPLKELATTVDLSGYKCLDCVTSKCKVCFQPDIITLKNGKLCSRETGRYKGFLVNQTALDHDAGNKPDLENAEDTTCDTPVNLDPEKLPGFVLPGGRISPDGEVGLVAANGDIVVGFDPASQMWAFGIVSDSGPPGKLGEASIAFDRLLQYGYKRGATIPRPQSYRADLLNGYQPDRPIGLLFLPGTKHRFLTGQPGTQHAHDFSPATVAREAKAAFLAWAATADIEIARLRFRRCLSLLPKQ